MMNVKFENNVLTVNTGIAVETYKKILTEASIKDENGSLLYAITKADKDSAEGRITPKMMVCNGVVDGNLAVVEVLPASKSLEDVKKMYGQALLNAQEYLPQILEKVTKEVADVAELFGDGTEATEEE